MNFSLKVTFKVKNMLVGFCVHLPVKQIFKCLSFLPTFIHFRQTGVAGGMGRTVILALSVK